MIRTFIAIDLPEETRQGLAQIQSHFKQTNTGVRWVHPASIHLTLKFLGNIDPVQVEPIVAAAGREVHNEPCLSLCADGLGVFPHERKPRIIWVGLRGETERLGRIQARIEDALVPLGFAREQRPFHPHLTLGRLKDSRRRQALINAMATAKLPEFNPFDVVEIILYKSDLTPTGAIYTKLHRMPLGTAASP
ncbi:MAG: RNA 2',3'-cyclic phosphodiesterase [Syntrophobacteria bacterium]